MAKTILYDEKAKQKLLSGIEKMEKAVVTTLGPAGKNVIIDEFGSIHSTKDGVSVARSITLKDPFENLGANAIKEVAQKSNDRVGDGTTTSTLLAAEIFRNGLKHVSFGANATQIKNGIMKAAKNVVEYIRKMSKPVESTNDIKRVCTVSANGDEQIGNMIANIMEKIGKDGTIKIEDGQTTELTSKVVEGMVLDNGYVSPWMVTNQEAMEAEYDNPLILLCNKKITNIQDILPCLQSLTQPNTPFAGRPLVIIADDYADDITATLVMNKMRGFNCVALKSPSFGDNRKAIMEDIAITIGGQVVSDETGVQLQSATAGSGILGCAKKVIVSKDQTIIFGGFGEKKAIDNRIASLKQQAEKATSKYDKEKFLERVGKLSNGVGVISVGADTEAERKEKRDRVDDAFYSAKAAVNSGIVPGGGVALLRALKHFQTTTDTILTDGTEKTLGFYKENGNKSQIDEAIGAKILLNSLISPMKKILENAGLNAFEIGSEVMKNSNDNYGFDAVKLVYVDMFEAGIVDATEVVVNEVTNAASIASLLLTTEALVVDEPEEKKDVVQPQAPGMY